MPVPNCIRGYVSLSSIHRWQRSAGVSAKSCEMFDVMMGRVDSEISSGLGPATSFLSDSGSKIPNWDLCAKEELGIYLGMIAAGRVGSVLAILLLVSYLAPAHFRHATLIVV
jgi:hypothetical protein